jgi:hypothetical protein
MIGRDFSVNIVCDLPRRKDEGDSPRASRDHEIVSGNPDAAQKTFADSVSACDALGFERDIDRDTLRSIIISINSDQF